MQGLEGLSFWVLRVPSLACAPYILINIKNNVERIRVAPTVTSVIVTPAAIAFMTR